MSDSFAGITVPDGDAGALEAAAGRFTTLGHSLSGIAGELRGMPGSLACWAGPASVSYAGACMTTSSAADTAVDAMGQAADAARRYARALEHAQDRAKEAIADARDAQERIDRAEREIQAAQDRQASAALAIRSAETEIMLAAGAGTPAPAAEAIRSQAQSDAANAAADEMRARRELEKARDDLERAQRKGREAAEDARDAGRGAAAAFHAAAQVSPAYAWFGGPASGGGGNGGGAPSWWDTENEGKKAWDEDQFLSQLIFFHPENDVVGGSKWWGDRVADVGIDYAGNALVAAGTRAYAGAISTRQFLDITTSRTFVAGRGGISVVDTITARPVTAQVIDYDAWQRAGSLTRAGRALPYVGAAVNVASAGWDQWRQDASNPNLTTTDRVGRAAGVGVYVGGASVAGAAIGTMIFPGVGTVAGLAIGATAGLVAGAVASSITPVKEFAADAGAAVANAAVDTVEWSGDRLQDLGEGISDLADKLPDIDMPDLNPF